MTIFTSHETQRILNNVYDDTLNKLRVDASLSIANSDGAITDGLTSSIKATVFDYINANPLGVILLNTSGDPAALNATISGTLNASIVNPSTYITNSNIPVTGTFWQSTQPVSLSSTINTSVLNASTYITNTSIPVTGSFYQGTQPVSAASLPLPAGAATDAKQDTGNTSVDSINTKTPALGQALAASSILLKYPR